MPLYLRQLPLGPMKNFVYLVGASTSDEVAVVDPAWSLPDIEAAAEADGKTIAAVVLSHCHPDHINAVEALLKAHDVPVYAQRPEIDFSPAVRAFGDALRPSDPGDVVPVGDCSLKLLHTPGHTPGSQCALVDEALISGDTVFVNACGRCDLKGGDPEALYRTISQVLMKLPGQTRLFPGHDYGDVPVSTLARERQHNPYFQFHALDAFVRYRMRPRR